jgi:hypothetical protein
MTPIHTIIIFHLLIYMLKARTVLQIPTPKILAWSSNASANPVQAEYIILEKVQGKELSHVWDDLSGRQKYEIVKQIVDFESRFAFFILTKFGSLYYCDNLPELSSPVRPLYRDQHGVNHECSRFVVGPTNSRMFFDDGRGEVEINRGPCERHLVSFILGCFEANYYQGILQRNMQ